MREDLKIRVAIWMVTYNHESFISQAIESVLSQQTDFRYHVYIGEDYSIDNTGNICETYAKKYPENITLVRNPKNLGPNKNALNIYNLCFKSGAEFIALLEGDDYWVDPLKLQKQVDFLEENKDFNICFHNVKVLNEGTGELEEDTITKKVNDITDIHDIARFNYIHTPSVLIRNSDLKMPKWFYKVSIGDWVLYMIAVKKGKIKKINEVMAVYRLHESNLWSSKDFNKRKKLTNRTVQIVLKKLKNLDDEVKLILKNRLRSEKKSFVNKIKLIISKI